MNKGDIVYYARVVPVVGLFEVIELKIRSLEDEWFSGVDEKTKQSFLLSTNEQNKTWFIERKPAADIIRKAEKLYGSIKLTKIKEEEND